MIRDTWRVRLADDQELLFVPIGDIHFGTDECDLERLERFIEWVIKQEERGRVVRMLGLGDYLDLASPSNRRRISEMYDSTRKSIDTLMLEDCQKFAKLFHPIRHCFLGLLTGHHTHVFTSDKRSKGYAGRTSDQFLADALGCRSYTDHDRMAVVLSRMELPHHMHLDVLALHGSGGGQTPGSRVMKRIRYSEIAPTAHIVVSGHDNARLAYPRSGLDWERGEIKRYVIGSGSFQRGYLEGQTGYAEEAALIPADLGPPAVSIRVEQYRGKWSVDYRATV